MRCVVLWYGDGEGGEWEKKWRTSRENEPEGQSRRNLSIMKGKMYKDRVGGGATCGDVDDGNKQATRLGGIRLGECLLGVR
jgi:hypothetical protein